MQGSNPKPVTVILDTKTSLFDARSLNVSTLRNIPLEESTIHLRVYSDGLYQNLPTKHSQIGFIIGLGDKEENFNVIH